MKLPTRKQIIATLYEHYENAELKDQLQWMKLFLVVSGYMKSPTDCSDKSEVEDIEESVRKNITEA